MTVYVKMLLHPARQKFNTFNTFTSTSDTERHVPLSRLDGPGTRVAGGGSGVRAVRGEGLRRLNFARGDRARRAVHHLRN
jgi:hypothetical protein